MSFKCQWNRVQFITGVQKTIRQLLQRTNLVDYKFWIALSDAKIEEIIGLMASTKKKVLIWFMNDVCRI